MFAQGDLNFCWIDVGSTRQDHVSTTIGEIDVALFVNLADVSETFPAVW